MAACICRHKRCPVILAMGFIPASFLVYLVHEKSSNGKCGIQEHHFETGNEAMKVPFPQDFFGMTSWLLWCLDVVWTQRHVGEMKHWQGINSCWLVGVPMVLSRKCKLCKTLFSMLRGSSEHQTTRPFPFFRSSSSVIRFKGNSMKLPKCQIVFGCTGIYRLPGPSALGKMKPN